MNAECSTQEELAEIGAAMPFAFHSQQGGDEIAAEKEGDGDSEQAGNHMGETGMAEKDDQNGRRAHAIERGNVKRALAGCFRIHGLE